MNNGGLDVDVDDSKESVVTPSAPMLKILSLIEARAHLRKTRVAQRKLRASAEVRDEELYLGNLHHPTESVPGRQNNRHCWTMFLSTSPSAVVNPTSVESVTYLLHPTFRQSKVTIKEPPFYVARRGWGYFDVQAKITFKKKQLPLPPSTADSEENCNNNNNNNNNNNTSALAAKKKKKKKKKKRRKQAPIDVIHSIHFGSPLVCSNVRSTLPYMVDSSKYLKLVEKQTVNNANKKIVARQKVSIQLRAKAKANEDDDDDEEEILDTSDVITQQSAKTIVFSGFTLTRSTLAAILVEMLGTETSRDIIAVICDFSCLSSLETTTENLENTSIIIENSYFVQLAIKKPILELVVRNCGHCKFQFSNVDRMCRAYHCIGNEFYCKGECTSYRFEKCDGILLHAWDHSKRILFLSLFTNHLDVQMFNSYLPGVDTKCVGSFQNFLDDDEESEEDNREEGERKDEGAGEKNVNIADIEEEDEDEENGPMNNHLMQSLKERVGNLMLEPEQGFKKKKKKKKKKKRNMSPKDLLKLRYSGAENCFISVWRMDSDVKQFSTKLVVGNSLMDVFD